VPPRAQAFKAREISFAATLRYVEVTADKRHSPVKVVQRLLGHKTAVLTLDRYGHLMPDDLDAVADAFDAAAESTADQLRTGYPETQIRPGKNGA
jgi:integrase